MKEKALKLQAYYKKLCDNERSSNLRNQQLLSELSRVDQHFQLLEEKLERLATLKVKKKKIHHEKLLTILFKERMRKTYFKLLSGME